MTKKLSTEPYKGVRDFYPEDMAVQNYIFDTWRKVAQRFGYEEYNASILEPTELYLGKSSEEIVSEQTYTFTDRGERSVTLRPEMTPTVARMVAARKRELSLPIRWFSIPNCFRYERPQRGRVREFWQFNADIFGVQNVEADIEIISLAHAIMKEFGAKNEDFEIRINDRALLKGLSPDAVRLLDKKEKMDEREFNAAWKECTGEDFKLIEEPEEVRDFRKKLSDIGVTNTVFAPTLARGFTYYSGLVFEVFDTNTENPRSLFGGGRYDGLLEKFGEETPAVGIAIGDVIMRDFLETHGLLPKTVSTTTIFVCPLSASHRAVADTLAESLRTEGIATAVYYGDKKIGDQIKIADKKHIPYIIGVGDEEVASSCFTLKKLENGEELRGTLEDILVRLSS
ncbi:MAG: histidine--tRNA ligase [Candidatus Campbellbacteria bacterium]